MDQALLAVFVQHWGAEWPERFYAPLDSRRFSTHLSTADLISVVWSSPIALARWWSKLNSQVFESLMPSRAS